MYGKLFILLIVVLGFTEPILTSCKNNGYKQDDSLPNEKVYNEAGCLYTSYNGLVMAGYQGWFTAEGDGAKRGWHHYEKNG